MTQANQNQNILDHPQGNTHNDYQTHTRKRSNPQSTSTSDNTTRTNKHILLSLLFSQSLHSNLRTRNNLLQLLYLHQLQVNMTPKTTGKSVANDPTNFQTSQAMLIRKLSNINDLMTDEERKDTKKCLVVQKSRENEFNPENPRFVTNLKYSLKTKFNSFKIADKVKIQNTATGEELFAKSRELPIIPDFSLPDNLNVWRIKNRSDEQKTYLVRNNQLDVYANVPYSAITAFPTPSDHVGEISKESLISENSKFHQELFIKETELQEVTIKLEQLRVKLDKQEKETSDDYWRRQYNLKTA